MIKTARQLKDLIRNLSREKSTDAQILMRNYMMERFLERISLSEYRDKFILKGGMLVAAMVLLIRNKIALLRSLYPSNPINPDKGSASQRRHRPWLKLYGEPSLPKQKALTRPPKAVPSSVSVLHTALTLCQGCKASSCSAHPV